LCGIFTKLSQSAVYEHFGIGKIYDFATDDILDDTILFPMQLLLYSLQLEDVLPSMHPLHPLHPPQIFPIT
jgi:hypothetical protein